jgi:type II secretory pathway component PulM
LAWQKRRAHVSTLQRWLSSLVQGEVEELKALCNLAAVHVATHAAKAVHRINCSERDHCVDELRNKMRGMWVEVIIAVVPVNRRYCAMVERR